MMMMNLRLVAHSSWRRAVAVSRTTARNMSAANCYSSWFHHHQSSSLRPWLQQSSKSSSLIGPNQGPPTLLSWRRTKATFRSSSSHTTKSQSSHDGTCWPSSFSDFVNGVPIVTRRLPLVGKVTIDFGTTMMNFGAITSLSGFCMTDVLLLRGLSVVGSLCGIIYNVTRVPKQLNAVVWGLVFISVNLVRIVQLIAERQEIKFSVEEADVYYRFFVPHGVNPIVFQKLLKEAEWTSVPPGTLVVEGGKPLHKVHLLVNGSATAYANVENGKHNGRLYSYSSRDNGCIIGATAVVDPTILGRNYPNNIVADEPVRMLSFSTEQLRNFLQKHDPSVEAALLHLMYVDLLGALRRNRQQKQQQQQPRPSSLSAALQELNHILVTACSNGLIHPQQRRRIRQHMEQHNISDSELHDLLQSEGWTLEEWNMGSKRDSDQSNKQQQLQQQQQQQQSL